MSQRLPQALEDYLRYHRIQGSAEATVKFYAKELRLFLTDLDSARQLPADLAGLHILDHLAPTKGRGLSPRTIRTLWQAITTWLNWGKEWDLIEESPAVHIKAPKVPKPEPLVAEKQFYALLELCPLNTLIGAHRKSNRS